MQVAIKIIKASSDPEAVKRVTIETIGSMTVSDIQQKVMRERVIWATASHQNIHRFYGYADDEAFGPFGALVSPVSSIYMQ